MPGDTLPGEALSSETLPGFARKVARYAPRECGHQAHAVRSGETNFSQLRGGEVAEPLSKLKQCIQFV